MLDLSSLRSISWIEVANRAFVDVIMRFSDVRWWTQCPTGSINTTHLQNLNLGQLNLVFFGNLTKTNFAFSDLPMKMTKILDKIADLQY